MIARFRAHKNLVSQTNFAKANDYNLLTWGKVLFDHGGHFDLFLSRLTPPAGLCMFGSHVWISQFALSTPGSGNPPLYVTKLFKNGQQVFEDNGTGVSSCGTYPASQVEVIPMWIDESNGSDYYTLNQYVTNPGAIVDGNPAHTWWNGVCFC